MKPPAKKSISRNCSGVALVVVLSIVVLMTILILAFTSTMQLDFNASKNYSEAMRAEELARGASQWITSELVQEISAGSTAITNAPGKVAYAPKSSGSYSVVNAVSTNQLSQYATMRPARFVSTQEQTSFPNLVRRSLRSADQTGLASGFWSTNAFPTLPVSAVSTTNASANGRRIPPAVWNKPLLLDPATATNTFRVPDWIYINRNGPAPLAGATTAPAAASDPASAEYILGRFAYTLYDSGGLLDVNVAGNALAAGDNAQRGYLHQADLTKIPGVSQAIADALVEWRSKASNDQTKQRLTSNQPVVAGSYDLFDPKNTFTSINPNPQGGTYDQGFVSRQDLLGFAKSQGLPDSSLQYLTTFSRALNAPAWCPDDRNVDAANVNIATPIRYLSGPAHANSDRDTARNFNVLGTTRNIGIPNRNLLRVTWPGNATITTWDWDKENNTMKTRPVVAGDPVLARRFPLSKIDLFRQYVDAKTANNVADITRLLSEIRYAFGLVPDRFFPNNPRRWEYVYARKVNAYLPGAVSVTSLQILTLDQATQSTSPYSIGSGGGASPSYAGSGGNPYTARNNENREPNFFEILQAGILRGSLNAGPPEGNEHFLNRGVIACQIGANIIDQYDGDNYPTHIRLYHDQNPNPFSNFNETAIAAALTGDADGKVVSGIEDLPYLSELLFMAYRPEAGAGTPAQLPDRQYVNQYVCFEVWNPHRNAGSNVANGPTDFRIVAVDGMAKPVFGTSTANTYFSPFATDAVDYTTEYNSDKDGTPYQLRFNYAAAFSEPTVLMASNVLAPSATSTVPSGYVGIFAGRVHVPESALTATHNPLNPTGAITITNSGGTTLPSPPQNPRAANSPGRVVAVNREGSPPLSFDLQYRDASNAWTTLQNVYVSGMGNTPDEGGPIGTPSLNFAYTGSTSFPTTSWSGSINSPNGIYYTIPGYFSRGSSAIDPRMGAESFFSMARRSRGATSTPGNGIMVDRNGPWVSEFQFPQGDAGGIPFRSNGSSSAMGLDTPTSPSTPAWMKVNFGTNPSNSSTTQNLYPNYALNDPTMPGSYLVGTDQVLRKANGSYAKDVLPMLKGRGAERPIMLNRPFRSVAELGNVSRGMPWQSLSFWDVNSADTGLLDLFSITETTAENPVVAGVVNLNSARTEVLSSFLSGAQQTAASTAARWSPSEADAFAASLKAGLVAADGIRFRGDTGFVLDSISQSWPHGKPIKEEVESLAAVIGSAGETRTWNLFVDVIAQSGRLPRTSGTADLARFDVQGQRRIWIHLAIDRFTGKVVARQMENVSE